MKYSYSNTKDFQICKARYFHKHVAKDTPFESTPELEFGNRVHKAFEDRLSAGRAFPEELAHYEPFAQAVLAEHLKLTLLVEHRLGIRANGSTCGFYDKDCFWCCKVDVALLNDVTCLIFDWKTGNQREDPKELAIQAVLLKAAIPTLEVIKGRYVWLKHNIVGELHNLSDTQRTWAEMQAMTALIKRSHVTNYWPEQEGPLCKWCPVYECRFNRNDAIAAGSSSGFQPTGN